MNTREWWKFILFVTLLAILITTLFTNPLVFLGRTHVPGLQGSDAFEYIWLPWWFDKALFTLHQSPAQIDRIYYPTPVYHPLVTAVLWSRLVALPEVHWGNPIAAYNVHLFASYVLTWVLMAILCLYLTGSRTGAVVGGAIFTLFANRTMHVLYGHFPQVLTYPYPLLVLCLWRVLKQPTFGRGIVLSGALILASSVDLMPLAYFVAPVTVGVLLLFLLTDRSRVLSRTALKSLGVGFGLAVLVLLPLMWPLLSRATQGELTWYHIAGVGDYSADALALFVPPPGHTLSQVWPGLRELSLQIYYSFGTSYTESIIYAGWGTLILAAIGTIWAWERRRDTRLWMTLAAVSSLLALGPILRVGGRLMTVGKQWFLLPYVIVMKLPLLSWGRTPARLHFTAMFSMAILAAYGARWLISKVRQRMWRWVVTAGLMALILFDSIIIFPWPMLDTGVPAFYRDLAADRRSVAVLDIPVGEYAATKYYMLYQIVHGHTIAGGHTSRVPAEAEKKMKELEALVWPGNDPTVLAEHGIGYVILHRDFLEPDEQEVLTVHLTNQLGPPRYEDKRIVAFVVPEALEIAPSPLVADP
jgi:hypothetical protein